MARKAQKLDADALKEELSVIVNGLPGAMGIEITQALIRRKIPVAPFALTGPGMPSTA